MSDAPDPTPTNREAARAASAELRAAETIRDGLYLRVLAEQFIAMGRATKVEGLQQAHVSVKLSSLLELAALAIPHPDGARASLAKVQALGEVLVRADAQIRALEAEVARLTAAKG